nr:LCP family protein [Clostridia bacterium]
MARKHGRRNTVGLQPGVLALIVVLLVLVCGVVLAHLFELRTDMTIANAGQQITAHTTALNTAQVFVNGKWYAERNVETLLVMGIDDYEGMETVDSYNNSNQTDFLVLYVRDEDSGRTSVLHLNRDTMTKITMLGVTGQVTGSRTAQLALAYNYGSGDHISSSNVVSAVEHLLYGIEVDHYLTVSMAGVPIINDWAGGVAVEVQDDFTEFDPELVQGAFVKLTGDQALTYVRTRKGLDDSSNLSRMERQRQYAEAWMETARTRLADAASVADLLLQMDAHYRTDCTAEDLQRIADALSNTPSVPIYELEGEAMQGETYMEFYVDEEALQRLVLEVFYAPVEG